MADPQTAATETADPAGTAMPAAGDAHGPAAAHAHPTPAAYVGIAVILAIVTAVEIALFYVDDVSDTVITVSLLVLMVVKFALVALWFMHLRFEAPIFKRLFVGGIILAVIVYAIVLGASHVFPVLVD
jgi:cytochrome c oxidase subunit 4